MREAARTDSTPGHALHAPLNGPIPTPSTRRSLVRGSNNWMALGIRPGSCAGAKAPGSNRSDPQTYKGQAAPAVAPGGAAPIVGLHHISACEAASGSGNSGEGTRFPLAPASRPFTAGRLPPRGKPREQIGRFWSRGRGILSFAPKGQQIVPLDSRPKAGQSVKRAQGGIRTTPDPFTKTQRETSRPNRRKKANSAAACGQY
jgi:hypothetical protein